MYEHRSRRCQAGVLLLLFGVGFCLCLFPLTALQLLAPDPSLPAVARASVVVQDVCLFILPPALGALLLFEAPAREVLSLGRPRVAALVCAVGLCGAWLGPGQPVLAAPFTFPAAMAAYFAGKLLIMPDVELGITAAMRPFNALVLLLCLVRVTEFCWDIGGAAGWTLAAVDALLLAAALPAARMGVRKWFI